MEERNNGYEFDINLIKKPVNYLAVNQRAQALSTRRILKKNFETAWLLKAVTCIDLTTLNSDDTFSNVQRLCYKAAFPIQHDILKKIHMNNKNISVAAVCVYPARVHDACEVIKSLGVKIPVASVAAGFPSGQFPLKTRLDEIALAVEDGASEIDIVINRAYALTGNWEGIYDEIKQMKKACGNAHLKTILATGELETFTNIYTASMVCMMAGADFIKTSTGKESVNATLPIGIVMSRAIRDYYELTDFKVGFKPAGGIRTAKDVLTWQFLMKEELGNDWLQPDLFRIGASSLLRDIEKHIFHNVMGYYANSSEFALC